MQGVSKRGGQLNELKSEQVLAKKLKCVFIVLFSFINYFVGKQGVAVVVHYLFLLPALFTSAYFSRRDILCP